MRPGTAALRYSALLLTALITSTASGEVLSFEALGLAQGLPQSQAVTLAQDADGYIWVGTWGGGLARYNGDTFTTLEVEDGLPSNRVQEVLVDRSGTLWVATTRGVAVWRGHRLQPVDLGFPGGARTRALAQDASGAIWAGTDRGVVLLAKDGPRLVSAGPPEPLVYDLLADGEGMLAVTDHGLFRVAPDLPARRVEGPAVAGDLLRAGALTGEGLWIGTSGDGLFLHDDAGWRRLAPSELPSRNVYRLSVGRSGTLYVSSQDAGLLRRPPSQRSFERISTEQGLPSQIVNDTLEDDEGNLWVATDIGGLARLRSEAATLHGTDGSFPSACIFGITQGPRPGTLWVGTLDGAVVYRSSPPYGVAEAVTTATGLVDPQVWKVVTTPDGEDWAYTETTYQLRRPGHARFDPPDPSWPLPRTTHGMAMDSEGRMWFSGQDSEHPLAMRDRRGRWTTWSTSDDGTPLQRCRSAAPRRAGGVWVSAASDMLACDGRTVRRLPGPPLPPDLADIFEDSLGRLWVGNEGGLAVRDTNGTWRKLGRADGFTARQVFFLGQDREGAIWAGAERGVFRILPDGRIRPFSTEDGLAGLETNQFAFHAGQGGEVWLGTVSGLTRYDPSHRPITTTPPRVVVEAAELPQRRVDFPHRLDLAWSERAVTFRVALLTYRDRSQVAYRARLEGLEDDWLPPRRSPELRYTNLPAGEHTLVIQALGDGGRPGETIRLPVRVVPPLWRTAWFQGGALAFLVLGAAGTHRLRVHVLRRRADELERVVATRTDELQQANEALERLASHDALTGLPNRRAVVERLRTELARGGRRLGCLVVDLDNFKTTNDTLGHAAGDRVLCLMARRIASSLREGDVAGRYGGDEFLLVLPGADHEAVETVARRVGVLAETCTEGGRSVEVTVSCGGVTVLPGAPRDAVAVLAAADELLYEVKRSGRAGFRLGTVGSAGPAPEGPPSA